MQEDFDFEDDDQPTQSNRNPLRERMREMESKIKQLEEAAAERDLLKKEKAFRDVGIDVSDPAAKYFIKAYDGDFSSDAIKQAAVEARLLSPAASEEARAEQEAWKRTNDVAAGAGSTSEIPDLEARIRNAETEEEVKRLIAEAQMQ
jgi:ribosomal protein L12E/L44/L45/RPP1/RPP2